MLKDSKGSLFQIFDFVDPQSVIVLQVVSKRFYVILQEYLSVIPVVLSQELLFFDVAASQSSDLIKSDFKEYLYKIRWNQYAGKEWKYEKTLLMQFYRNEAFGSNQMVPSHEYVFSITAQTYLLFPVAIDTKTIDKGVKISIMFGTTRPLRVVPIAPVPIKVYRPLAVIARFQGSSIIYLLGGTTKKNCQRYLIEKDRWEPLYHFPQQFSTKAIAVGCQVLNQIFVFSLPLSGQELHLVQMEITASNSSEEWTFTSLQLQPEDFQLVELLNLQSAVYDNLSKEIVIFGKGMLKKPGMASLVIRLAIKLGKVQTFTISKIDFSSNPHRFGRPCFRLSDRQIVQLQDTHPTEVTQVCVTSTSDFKSKAIVVTN